MLQGTWNTPLHIAGESHVYLRKHFDMWSLLVIALTLILFVVALFIRLYRE